MNQRSFFSGETWVLNKLSELAMRCGLSPTVANVCLTEHWSDKQQTTGYSLAYVDGNAAEHQQDAMQKFTNLLGFEGVASLNFPDLESVEKAVDHALTLAPRARTR